MTPPPSAVLSASQLQTLRMHGEERSADVGEVLFRVGDRSYPFIAIIDGEAAVLDAAGREIVRHGASGFLGEMNLLSGQTVYLTAVVTQPMRYVAVEREALRPLLFDDAPLGDVLLSSFMARREALQQQHGVGLEIEGPRSSEATRRIVDFARRNRLPHTWLDTERADPPAPGSEIGRPLRRERRRSVSAGAAAGWRRAAQPDQRRGLARARHRARAGAARGGRPARRRRRSRRSRRRRLRGL